MSKNRFEGLQAKTEKYGESNDCSVKAWSVVAGISYEEAHGDMARFGGRRPGGRVNTRAALNLGAAALRDVKLTDVTKKYKAKTVVALQRELPSRGKFLIFVKGHVAAFQGGQLHDWTDGRRYRIVKIFRVNAA